MNRGRTFLKPEERAAIVRQTFEAVMMAGFLQWWHSEPAETHARSGYSPREEWEEWLNMTKHNWGWFQAAAAKSTDDNLLNVLAYWKTQANALGLKEWEHLRDTREARPAEQSPKQPEATTDKGRAEKSRELDLDME